MDTNTQRALAQSAADEIVEQVIGPMLEDCATGRGVTPEDYDTRVDLIPELIIRYAFRHERARK